jgi:membrane protease YdiL (CAAX protease family)
MAKVSLSKEQAIKHATIIASYLLIVWGFYRFLFKFPDEIEELVSKPIIWLIPVFFALKVEKQNLASIGITFKNLFPSIYFVLGLGALFVIEGVILNYLKHGGLNFGANIGDSLLLIPLGLSFATALTEEVTFRGYIFTRIWKALGSEWWANLLTTAIWTMIHIPWLIFGLKLGLGAAVINLIVIAAFGVGSAFLFAKTGNIFSSILLHVLWSWPIILFR